MIRAVSKADVFKGDVAVCMFQNSGFRRIGDLLLAVQQLKGAPGGGQRGLQRVDHEGRLCQGLRRLVDILEKRLHNAHRHGSVQHGLACDNGNYHIGKPVQQADKGVDAVGQKVRLLVGGAVFLRGRSDMGKALLLVVICLDDIPPVIVFLHNAGQLTDCLLAFSRAAQVLFGHNLGNHHADGHEGQKNAGQKSAVIEHDGQRADDRADGHHHLQQTGLEHLGYFIQVAGDTAEDLTGFVLVKEAEGKPVELSGDLVSQFQVQALRHICHQVGLQIVEHPGKAILNAQLCQFLSHIGPGDGKRNAVPPGGLYALPEVVDDHRAEHRGIDAQAHIDHDGNGDNSKAGALPLQLAEQPRHSAPAVRAFHRPAHASCASFVCDS